MCMHLLVFNWSIATLQRCISCIWSESAIYVHISPPLLQGDVNIHTPVISFPASAGNSEEHCERTDLWPSDSPLPQPFHANPSHLKVWIKDVNITNRMTGLRRCLWSEFEDINLYRLSNKRAMRLLWCLLLCTWDYHILDHTRSLVLWRNDST